MKLKTIGVLLLGVTDLDRSLHFYRDQLGMDVKWQIPGFAFLDGGGITFGLSQELAKSSAHTVGATEVVFAVENVRAAHAELGGQGVEFFREPRNVTGTEWAANFRDPDGHNLSIFGPEGKA